MRQIYLFLCLVLCFCFSSHAQEISEQPAWRALFPAERLALNGMAVLYEVSAEEAPRYLGKSLQELLLLGLDQDAIELWENMPNEVKKDPARYFWGSHGPIVFRFADNIPETIDNLQYAHHDLIIDLAVAYTSIGQIDTGLEYMGMAREIGPHALRPGEHCKYDIVREMLAPRLRQDEILDFFILPPNSNRVHLDLEMPGRLACVWGESASLQEMVISYLRKRGFYSLSNLWITQQEPYEIALFSPPLEFKPPKQYEAELRQTARAYQAKIDERIKSLPRRDERRRFMVFQSMKNVEELGVQSAKPLLAVPNEFALFDAEDIEARLPHLDELQVFEDAENERLYIWKTEFNSKTMWRVEKVAGSYMIAETFRYRSP